MAAVSSVLEGEVYVAELVEESPTSSRRELNLSMLSTVAISIVFLLLAMSFGNAIIYDSNDDVSFSGEWWETPSSPSTPNGFANGHHARSTTSKWHP